MTIDDADEVVLIDALGRVSGRMSRASVHGVETPRHLAFSLYLFDNAGELLLTRRALTKTTWPGVWTNSCCGHPRPDEPLHDAVRRRTSEELGVTISELTVVLPDFTYRASDPSGLVENEFCPVFAATLNPHGSLAPNKNEVMDWAWVKPTAAAAAASATPFAFSPWFVLQMAHADAAQLRT